MISKDAKIFIAGHMGLVGSALKRAFENRGYTNFVLRTRVELDLMDAVAVAAFFQKEQPHIVVDAAARVGGIWANSHYPAEFIYQNLVIQNNIIHNAYVTGVQRLLFLGSACIYPRESPQPIKEEYLLTGLLEETNKAYSIAKIAGITMCDSYRSQYGVDFFSAMPTNLYGERDNFDLETAHVIPALLRKFHEAKVQGSPTVTLWGTGIARRDFLHVNDVADACVFLLEQETKHTLINIGSGLDIALRDLATLIAEVVGFSGELVWDSTKPDGMPVRVLDTQRLRALGWQPTISLRDGLRMTYDWYVKNQPIS